MVPEPSSGPGDDVPISAGEQERIVPSLSTRAQLRELERLGIHAARIWSMRPAVLARGDLLSEAFVRELHRRMFAGIWRGAGRYRASEGAAGWEPRRIAEGVRMFLDDAEGWLRFATYPVPEAAVRLHHRLIAVRPWTEGNRRHARLLADIVVAAHGEPPLTWGSRAAPSAAAGARYLDAIRAADNGEMAPLLDFARN
jgi:Fic-DOC domain mobile mystery protein B